MLPTKWRWTKAGNVEHKDVSGHCYFQNNHTGNIVRTSDVLRSREFHKMFMHTLTFKNVAGVCKSWSWRPEYHISHLKPIAKEVLCSSVGGVFPVSQQPLPNNHRED